MHPTSKMTATCIFTFLHQLYFFPKVTEIGTSGSFCKSLILFYAALLYKIQPLPRWCIKHKQQSKSYSLSQHCNLVVFLLCSFMRLPTNALKQVKSYSNTTKG